MTESTARPPGGYPAPLARGGAAAHLARTVALLDALEDVLAGRPDRPAPPPWCEARGWSRWLLDLDEASLEACEAHGPERVLAARADAPESLRALAREVEALSAWIPRAVARPGAEVRRASPRKRDQLEALAALAPRGVRRVLDLGAGRGHLTRRLARELGVPALGLERRDAVVGVARAIDPSPDVSFEAREIGPGLEVRPDDLLVGLHACGALGDLLAQVAAAQGAAVLLVPCCPQKIPGELRAPLSRRGRPLPRILLGLANVAGATEAGTTVAEAAHRRSVRHAVRLLLAEEGIATRPGEESIGVNRRQFRRTLAELAPKAFAARGLPPPSAARIEAAEARAQAEQRAIRRLMLPRTMLARPLELAVVLDRAAALEEGTGGPPEVLEAFPASVSPRNLVIRRGPP